MEKTEENLLAKRLNEICKARKSNCKELAGEIGVKSSTFQRYTSGAVPPSAEVFVGLHLNIGISLDWFVTGQGDMYAANRIPSVTYNGNSVAVHQNNGMLQVRESTSDSSGRGSRICLWVQHYIETHSADECAWLDVAMGKAFPEYAEWKKGVL